MTADTDNDFMTETETAWRRWRVAADRLGSNGLERQTPAGWTAKEMVGHVAFWEEAIEPVITAMFRGEQLPDGWRFGSGYTPEEATEWPRSDVHNAREAAWARGQSAAEVLARLDRAHARALEIAATFTDDERGNPRFRDYFAEKAGHYDEHLAELNALLADTSEG